MSQVDELLNGLSEEDIATYTANQETEPHIVVGEDRYIAVPEELKRIAVQYDHNIETVTFDCPRYWDGNDISLLKIYVNYRTPEGVVRRYPCNNVTVDSSNTRLLHFDWVISKNVTRYAGNIDFIVCAKETDALGKEVTHWNTEINQDMYISEGLEPEEDITESDPDIVTQLLLRMDNVEEVALSADLLMANKYYTETKEYVDSENAKLHGRVDELLAKEPPIGDTYETYDIAGTTPVLDTTPGYVKLSGKIITNGISAALSLSEFTMNSPIYETYTATGDAGAENEIASNIPVVPGGRYRLKLAGQFTSLGGGSVHVYEHGVDNLIISRSIHVITGAIFTFTVPNDVNAIRINVSYPTNASADGASVEVSLRAFTIPVCALPEEVLPLTSPIDCYLTNENKVKLLIDSTLSVDIPIDVHDSIVMSVGDDMQKVFPYPLRNYSIVDTELKDIRVDVDGMRHATAGEAVRSQINKVDDRIDDISSEHIYNARLAALRDMGNLHGDGSVLIYPAFGTINYPEGAEPDWAGALETGTYLYATDPMTGERVYLVSNENRTKAIVFAIPRGYTFITGQHIAETNIRHIIVPNTVTNIETGDPMFFFGGENIDFVPSIDLSDYTDGKPFPTYQCMTPNQGLTLNMPTWSEDADPEGAPDGEALLPCTIYVAKGRKAELAAMTAWCEYADYMVEV